MCAFVGGILALGASAEDKEAPTLPPEVLRAVVVIEGNKGSGTGFVTRFDGKPCVVTNQHVLANNSTLKIVNDQGKRLKGSSFVAAVTADIALIQLSDVAADQAFLTLAEDVESKAGKGDVVMIPGNSQGDGVITVTPGQVIAVGAKKVEVDNPVYPGNSGSPIIHAETNEVLGVLTEATVVELDKVSEKSFENEDSQIKSEIRYFGHRIDTVKRWKKLVWRDFRKTSELVATFDTELKALTSYLFDADDDKSYQHFKDLADSNERALKILRQNLRSDGEKVRAIRDVTRYMRVLATRRIKTIEKGPLYYTHKQQFDNQKKLSKHLVDAIKILDENFKALERIVF